MYLPSIFIDPIRNKLIELSFALRKIYYQIKGYHQPAERLLSDAQKEGYDFSLPDVKNWLHRQAIWQIHSPLLNISHKFHLIGLLVRMSTIKLIYYICLGSWDTVKGKVY